MSKGMRLFWMLLALLLLLASCISPQKDEEAVTGITTAASADSLTQTAATTAKTVVASTQTEATSSAAQTQPGDPYWSNEAEDGESKRY